MLRPAPSRGFSLIELMVTLALLGFLLLLGLPAFSTMIKNTQVRTVADALQNGIRLARSEALRLNQPTVFLLTNATPALNATPVAGGNKWWVQTVPHLNGDPATGVPNGSGTLSDVASNVSIAGTTSAGNTVSVLCFNSNGRLTDLGGVGPVSGSTATCSANAVVFDVRQAGADRNLQVMVNVGGQVHMCDPKRNGNFDGC